MGTAGDDGGGSISASGRKTVMPELEEPGGMGAEPWFGFKLLNEDTQLVYIPYSQGRLKHTIIDLLFLSIWASKPPTFTIVLLNNSN